MSAAEATLQVSDREMSAVAQLVYRHSGIVLHDGKRSLVAARLHKRLRALGCGSLGEYMQRVEGDGAGTELVTLIDAITTNHTYFFREPQHFGILRDKVVPEAAAAGKSSLRIWCAAASTGEEPYTLAVTLLDAPGALPFTILGSDISTKALAAAAAATYKLSAVEAVPKETLRRHFERGQGAQEGLARVASHVTRLVTFRRLNLLDIKDIGDRFDAVFCRNVMIYFDKTAQQRTVSMLERHLAPGGYLFVSHAESLNGLTHGLRWVAPAVYRRPLND